MTQKISSSNMLQATAKIDKISLHFPISKVRLNVFGIQKLVKRIQNKYCGLPTTFKQQQSLKVNLNLAISTAVNLTHR